MTLDQVNKWSYTTKTVLACIVLGHSSFTEICKMMEAKTFSAREKVRNALQALRKEKVIYYDRKWKLPKIGDGVW